MGKRAMGDWGYGGRTREEWAVEKCIYMAEKSAKEMKECARVFRHEAYRIDIIDEKRGWMTVRVTDRETKAALFEGSILKKPGNGIAYRFKSAVALWALGVPA